MNLQLKTTFALALASSFLSLTTPLFAANAPAASPAERAKIEEVVHQYLLAKPEVLVEAMQTLQRKQAEQAQEVMKETQKNASKFASALFHQKMDPVVGNPASKITVVEFFDYQCPHCIDMGPVIDAIVKANPNNVRIVFKDFPIRGPASEMAARAAIAANLQGKYFPFHLALLAAPQPLTADAIMTLAKQMGLDIPRMKKDMDANSTTEQLKADVKLAQDLKLFGTPAFFIGKTALTDNSHGTIHYAPGQISQSQLQDMIDQAAQ